MGYTREQIHQIWLTGVDGIGSRRFAKLLARYGSAEAVWEEFGEHMRWIGEPAFKALATSRNRGRLDALLERMERMGVQAVFHAEAEYPPLLRELSDAPPLLFVRGAYDLSDPLTVGVVGARSCSRYGQQMTNALAGDLARAGVAVVSGFARGIDSAAHKAALDAGGRTIAVLGCGVDIVYPPENVGLRDRLLEGGGSLVSEYSLSVAPLAGNFPARNRLISGMSRGLLLVEAAKGSGAMITVDFALEQGREVFVLPGPANAGLSTMPNHLAREGARVVTSAQELLEDLGRFGHVAPREDDALPMALNANEQRIYNALQDGAHGVDDLVERTGLDAATVNSGLTMLAIQGIIKDIL